VAKSIHEEVKALDRERPARGDPRSGPLGEKEQIKGEGRIGGQRKGEWASHAPLLSTSKGAGAMETNFTVILFSRQHFGNGPGGFDDIEPSVQFVGPTKDFSFNCPSVEPAETAVLMFQSRDVDHQRNVFRVNGVDVFGGLPAGNVLHLESRNSSGGGGGSIDDFIIDNVVIMYKTRGGLTQPVLAG
jgi:hypothetical protein